MSDEPAPPKLFFYTFMVSYTVLAASEEAARQDAAFEFAKTTAGSVDLTDVQPFEETSDEQ